MLYFDDVTLTVGDETTNLQILLSLDIHAQSTSGDPHHGSQPMPPALAQLTSVLRTMRPSQPGESAIA